MKRLIKNALKGNNPKTLLMFNLTIFMLFGLAPWTVTFLWSGIALSIVLYFLYICLGVSITYHRSLTHKTLKLHPVLQHLFVTFACLAGTGSPIMWVMTHRQHHRFSDKLLDPHPPGTVWKTLFGAYPKVSTQGIKDIAEVPYFRFWHRYYFGILIVIGLTLLFIHYSLFIYAFVIPIVMSVAASNLLNWYGHTKSKWISYRNYEEVQDHSQNNRIFGLAIFGEGWHNNHHKFPGSARFGLTAAELDIGYVVIFILEKLGLATNVKTANTLRSS